MARVSARLRLAAGFALLALLAGAGRARSEDAPDASPPGAQQTPARLSFVDGSVSFWRPGAEDWAPARANTPLAAGDQLYAGSGASLELQLGARSFLRAGAETQLALDSQEPDFLQFRVTAGNVSLDLRTLHTGHTVEIDTPNAAFTVEHSGYYRIEVDGGSTKFISRRGGRATLTPAGGESAAIEPSEEVVVSGTDAPQIGTYVAPELDAWDRWNYERTDGQIDAVSSRYVPDGVYGADQLDQYGSWRVVPTYGAVWIPTGVAPTWVPYSTGRWIFDPFYGWTWVDDAPWGWAPFHYGRWVHLGGYWGWAPGPVVVRPYYAPALVAFFSGGNVGISVRLGLAAPTVGWVALGWGEPCHPWWGPSGFAGHPHWLGWGGPHVAFNQTVINAKNVNVYNVYQNARVPNAIVATHRLGDGPVTPIRVDHATAGQFRPVLGSPPVKASSASRVGGPERAARPPQRTLDQRVVATRSPVRPTALPNDAGGTAAKRAAAAAAGQRRIVQPPKSGAPQRSIERAPFGQQAGPERSLPPPLPRYDQVRQREEATRLGTGPTAPQQRAPQARRQAPAFPVPSGQTQETERGRLRSLEAQRAAPPTPTPTPAPQAAGGGRERVASPGRELPGEPANRVYRGHVEARPEASAANAQRAPAHSGENRQGRHGRSGEKQAGQP
jgi:hypothetical protein